MKSSMAVDYRQLLVRYMAQVLEREGVTFVHNPERDGTYLTAQDKAELGRLELEAKSLEAKPEDLVQAITKTIMSNIVVEGPPLPTGLKEHGVTGVIIDRRGVWLTFESGPEAFIPLAAPLGRREPLS